MFRRILLLAVFAFLLVTSLASAMPAPEIQVNPPQPVQYERVGLQVKNVGVPGGVGADYKTSWKYQYNKLDSLGITTVYTGTANESVYGSLPTFHVGPVQVQAKVTNRQGDIFYGEAITRTSVISPTPPMNTCGDSSETDIHPITFNPLWFQE